MKLDFIGWNGFHVTVKPGIQSVGATQRRTRVRRLGFLFSHGSEKPPFLLISGMQTAKSSRTNLHFPILRRISDADRADFSVEMDESVSSGKRKSPEPSGSSDGHVSGPDSTPKRPNIARTCIHEVAVPSSFTSPKDADVYGTLSNPTYNGEPAKTYPFQLDAFQSVSVACLERNESVLVSAHTSAGKTAVAEYAIAMSFRDKQRVIYTSPLKALSNQKYRELSQEFSDVGLMTGDVTLAPNSSCLVMTTEILRGMLYRGSEVLKEVAWVIFDEIHYMKDRERGVVWEESIIFMPPAIKMVFLSATMSNATEFAEWICSLHKQPCHVVYTDFRPTPLQHYMFPMGGSGLFLVVDETEQFREDNFMKLQDTFAKQKKPLGDGNRSGGPKASGRIAKGGTASAGSDIYKIVKMIMERKFQPVIIFSFSRRECEQHAMSMSKLDFNTKEEKDSVEEVFKNAMQCLNEEDRNLPAIELMLPLLQRGIAVHHSGLLPIIKELVELLFQEGLIKALFATETFAMGLNMPAKTVVFTSVKKWDGDSHRYIGSGEYIQMSGRAGRRGKDERGICIIMIDEQSTSSSPQMEMNTLKDMVLGKPAPLVSTFRLSYYSILNLMSRTEGQFTAEHVIRNSFHQFQYEKALPDIGERVSKLEKEAEMLETTGEAELSEYHRLKLDIAQLEKKMMSEIGRPERALYFLTPGRLVKVRDGSTDWGWGVVVNVVKKPAAALGTLPSSLASVRSSSYIVDTLLHCSPGQTENGARPKPRPPGPGEKGEMHVVPVQLPLISALSSIKISLTSDLRPAEARQSILLAVQELGARFPQGLPKLDPVKDMGIDDPEFVELVNQIGELEQKLIVHPLHKSSESDQQTKCFQRKAEVNHEIQQLKSKMRESQLQKFRDELKNRSRVLKRLGHVDADCVVQLKGRAACLIDTGDELLVTELMFNGTFNDLDHHQVAALASCFIPGDKSNEQIHLRTELAKPLQQLQDTARRIAEIQRECKLEINVDEYVESTVRPYLMDVIYCWSKGASFAEVMEMTDIFEGSVIRLARRLDEFLNQLHAAAQAVGEANLESKFAAASEIALPSHNALNHNDYSVVAGWLRL
ncbi:Helix-loop-helix protein 2 [Asimina triloba]